MDQQILEELRLAGAGFATGLQLMAVYDGLRILRIFVPHSWAAVGLEDFCYWIYSGLTVFALLYRGTGGSIRAYIIAAAAAGMIFWDRLVSRKVLGVLQKFRKYHIIQCKKDKKLVSK